MLIIFEALVLERRVAEVLEGKALRIGLPEGPLGLSVGKRFTGFHQGINAKSKPHFSLCEKWGFFYHHMLLLALRLKQ
jgi:hypothetical protein